MFAIIRTNQGSERETQGKHEESIVLISYVQTPTHFLNISHFDLDIEKSRPGNFELGGEILCSCTVRCRGHTCSSPSPTHRTKIRRPCGVSDNQQHFPSTHRLINTQLTNIALQPDSSIAIHSSIATHTSIPIL